MDIEHKSILVLLVILFITSALFVNFKFNSIPESNIKQSDDTNTNKQSNEVNEETPFIIKKTIVTLDSNSKKIIINTSHIFNIPSDGGPLSFLTISSDFLFTNDRIVLTEVNTSLKNYYSEDNIFISEDLPPKKSFYIQSKDGNFSVTPGKITKSEIIFEKVISEESYRKGVITELMGFSTIGLIDQKGKKYPTKYIIEAESIDSTWQPYLPFYAEKIDKLNNKVSYELKEEPTIGYVSFYKKGVEKSRLEQHFIMESDCKFRQVYYWDSYTFSDTLDSYLTLYCKDVDRVYDIKIILNNGEVRMPVRYNSFEDLENETNLENEFFAYATKKLSEDVGLVRIRIKYPDLKRIQIQFMSQNPSYWGFTKYRFSGRISYIPIAVLSEANSTMRVLFEIPEEYIFSNYNYSPSPYYGDIKTNRIEFELNPKDVSFKPINLDIEYFFTKYVTCYMYYINLFFSCCILFLLFLNWKRYDKLSYLTNKNYKSIIAALTFIPLSIELPLLLDYSNYIGLSELLIGSYLIILIIIWIVVNLAMSFEEKSQNKLDNNMEKNIQSIVNLEHKINATLKTIDSTNESITKKIQNIQDIENIIKSEIKNLKEINKNIQDKSNEITKLTEKENKK